MIKYGNQISLTMITLNEELSVKKVIDDIKKMREIIKEKGLEEYVRQTTETLKDIENIAIKVAEKSGHVVSSLAELTGYIFLLVPILEVVLTLIAREGFDIVTLFELSLGITLS